MITDYDSLKAEVANQIARSDVTSASASVETAIQLAEKLISRSLRVIQMEKEQDLTATASQDYIDLASDFIETRALRYTDNPGEIQYVPLSIFKKLTSANSSERPSVYTIGNNATSGVQTIKLAGTPDDAYTLEHTYYATIPALSDSQTTNWLITYDPELYLNASLYFIYRRFRNVLAGEYLQLTNERISTMNEEDQNKRMGPGGSRVRVLGVV